MDIHFIKVTDIRALKELTDRSRSAPVVIFKHSLTCGISASAYEQMAAFEGEVTLVEIQKARALSAEIADRFGIAHESPQAIVLHNGEVVWNGSHFKITAEAVANAVRGADDGKQ